MLYCGNLINDYAPITPYTFNTPFPGWALETGDSDVGSHFEGIPAWLQECATWLHGKIFRKGNHLHAVIVEANWAPYKPYRTVNIFLYIPWVMCFSSTCSTWFPPSQLEAQLERWAEWSWDCSSRSCVIWGPHLVRLDECRDFPFPTAEMQEVSSFEILQLDIWFLALLML